MTATATDGPALDFAVLGNAPDALRWLENVLAALPAVWLIDHATGQTGATLTGMVRPGLELTGLVGEGRPRRLVTVLEDPVARLADPDRTGDAGPSAGTYAPAVARLAREFDPDEILVLAADEAREALPCLLTHVGVDAAPDLGPLDQLEPAAPVPLSQGRRSVLFARVREDVEDLEQLAGRSFRRWRISEPSDQEPRPPVRSSDTAVFYAGRRADASAPPGSLVLDEWGVLPVHLGPVLERAASMTIRDPLSFPFDSLREGDRAIPLAVRLPSGWSAPDLELVLGAPLLSELGPFDEVSGDNHELLARLRERYMWPATMLASEGELGSFAARAALHEERPLRAAKAAHRVLRDALRPELAAGLAAVPPAEGLRAVIVAARPERWAPLLPAGTELTGVAGDAGRRRAARLAYPGSEFAASLQGRDETAHIGLGMFSLVGQSPTERARRISALYRAVRVGGRMIVTERFVDGRGGRAVGAPSPTELLEEINRVSAGHLVATEVRGLRLDGDDLNSIGLFSFVKIGRPERL